MGDDQVVARELEQAEARLSRSKGQFWKYWLGAGDPPNTEDLATLDDSLNAAIEVGRLRALPAAWVGEQQAYDAAWSAHRDAGYPVDRETHMAFSAGWLAASRHYYAALAAREEVEP